jgi:hypothetical protein
MHHLAYIIRRKRINFPIAFKFIGQFIITGNKSKKKNDKKKKSNRKKSGKTCIVSKKTFADWRLLKNYWQQKSRGSCSKLSTFICRLVVAMNVKSQIKNSTHQTRQGPIDPESLNDRLRVITDLYCRYTWIKINKDIDGPVFWSSQGRFH